jgi:hypothetical protein
MAHYLKPMGIDTLGDEIILQFEDESGEPSKAAITTLEAATLISALGQLIEEISVGPARLDVTDPDYRSWPRFH